MADEDRKETGARPSSDPFTPEGRIDPSFEKEISLDRRVWFRIWEEDRTLRMTSHRPLLGRLLVLGRKLLRPVARFALADLYQRQRLFNLSLLYTLEDIYRRWVPREEFEQRFVAIQEQLRRTASEIMDRDDAVFHVLDQKSDWIEESLRRLEEQVVQRDAILSSRLEKAPAARGPAGTQAGPRQALDDRLGYVRFEDTHRGTEEDIGARQEAYVSTFAGLRNVLDVGCGRGEFLLKLRKAGIEAYGVDHSEEMAALCRKKDLRVEIADAVSHLASLPDGSLGGIFAAQVIEHLDLSQIVRLLTLASAKIRPGGRIVLETQNPEAMRVGASTFYRDPSHVRPLHPDGLSFLLRSCGFRDVSVLRLRYPENREALPGPRTPPDLSPAEKLIVEDVSRLTARLNDLFFGSQDYAVSAVR